MELGKITARELCEQVPMPPSEFALQTCHSKAFIIQDFTTDKSIILSKIDPIKANGDNNFVEHLLNPNTGLLNVAKYGKYNRTAILYTDAWWYPLKDSELKQCLDTCKKYGIRFFAIIYSRPEAQPNGIKKSLQTIADATGGILFDGVTSKTAAKEIGSLLQSNVQGTEPCNIVWESAVKCESSEIEANITLEPYNLTSKVHYEYPINSLASLLVSPTSLFFLNTMNDTCISITLTAINADFHISGISLTNPSYAIKSPVEFNLEKGQSTDLEVCYYPSDSSYSYCKFTVNNDLCPSYFQAVGGFPGKRPSTRTIKLIHPNGGEVFVAGTDTIITWDGVMPNERVSLDYSTDNGTTWKSITKETTGLEYKWRVPKTPSNNCLARVIANLENNTEYSGILICNQVWMGMNLDVVTYRNGDIIRKAESLEDWIDAIIKGEGAWCYYGNSDSLGRIYGLLYNYYAVTDKRGLAPKGWHIPTYDDWIELEKCLGGSNVAGGKLKSTGTIENSSGLWQSPNEGATNQSGFTALPGGFRWLNGTFYEIGQIGYWWAATEKFDNNPWTFYLSYYSNDLKSIISQEEMGYSVRCIKD